MASRTGRLTQKEIAQIAGVSQATVSIVLNDREGTSARIPAATRERVKQAIAQTTYVADPAARRLAGLDNKILGIFTYESARSPESMDFYGPLLNGIEVSAERLGCDLLFFTGAPVVDGARSLFHPSTRFRLADGCVLLGQNMAEDDLRRLVAEDFPFVAVGRRDEPDVPYVGLDYRSLTRGLVERAAELGHRRAIYVHHDNHSPASRDRRSEIETAHRDGALEFDYAVTTDGIERIAERVIERGITAVLTEDQFLAERLAAALAALGVGVPQVSLAALAEVRGHLIDDRALAGFITPRIEMAAGALDLLQEIITTPAAERDALETQRLLTGAVEFGETLVPAGGTR